jgi:hypothetical protein
MTSDIAAVGYYKDFHIKKKRESLLMGKNRA